ncbi:MAG: hypothetical protein ACWGHO_00025 [Candidatus Moraniibacteriota bacterium]
MEKSTGFYVCEICGISIPNDLMGCPICNPFKDLFPTDKHDQSLFPKLENVDWEEVSRRNRDFFRSFEQEINSRHINADKAPAEFPVEKLKRFLGEI